MARKFAHLLIAAAMALAGLAATSLDGPATAHADSTPPAPWIVRSGAAAPSTSVAGSEVRLLWSIDPAGTGALRDTDLGTDLSGASAPACTPVALGPGSVIPVGGHTDCSATYALTQADVDAGVVRAGWHADTLADGTGPGHVEGTIAVPVAAEPALSLRIDGISPVGPLAAGTTAHVQVTGTNDSRVTITDLTLAGSGRGFDTAACTPALPSALAPHASITCDVGLVLTQADVDDNPSATIALAGTTLAHGSTAARVQYRPSVTRTSGLAVDTVASPGSAVVAGDTIGVTTTITNSGTMTLRRLVATDRSLQSLGRDGLACATPASLAPGQSLTCTGSRTATQADVNAGAVQDAVSARASDPVGRTVVGSDSVTVGALAVDELTLAVDATPSSGLRTGQIVHYAITATNTGTLTLHGVDVSVPPTVDGLDCTPATPATLDPGDAVACDATHTVTQADVDDGTISADIATSGLNPTDDPVSDEVTSDVTTDPTTLLAVSGSANPSVGLAVGDTTTFTAVVTNIGARTVSGVTLTNGLTGIGPTTCTPVAGSALAPAQSMTCTATYT
ncbi:MAG TPA: hypothetical protein VEQ83_11855, partial [Lapillicoccus sp.]|nr:hypothetical protein [Lapillicoccus sp.]